MAAKYTWDEAIEILRSDEQYKDFIHNAYLSTDVKENCSRYYNSVEFKEILAIIKQHFNRSVKVMDMPAGGGIATYGFAKSGFEVAAVDPDNSASLGRQAIEFIKAEEGLDKIEVVDAYGEDLPFKDQSFDVVFVRQGLHHAQDLNLMLKEIARVLKKGGILIAVREHVVDDYEESLKAFLDSQVDHQLYGGENAFMLKDYRSAILGANLNIEAELKPFDSIINYFPSYSSPQALEQEILSGKVGKLLSIISKKMALNFQINRYNKQKTPGRLYSFIAKKTN